mgnify:CR=1 FL=1
MHLLKFDWNPVTGIDIAGNFKLHFYSLMWVVAFILGWYIMKRIFTKEKISIDYLDPLFIYTVLATMLGARLGHVLFYQSELISQDFFSIFLPFKFKGGFEFTGFQGLASHGAAIGIIIGASFNKVIDVLVKKVFLPPLSLLTGGVNMQNKRIILREAVTDAGGTNITDEVAIGYGALGEAFLDFMIIGFTVFIVVKFMNKLRNKAQDTKDKTVVTPKDIELLSHLTELMEEQNALLKAKQ